MADSDNAYNVGFGKPPKRSQFTKGQSGNPKGRPRGSQNFPTILAKASRERVKITTNGGIRYITKFEASMLQLMNKAASGDLKAINELRYWTQWLADSQQTDTPPPVLHESDNTVMASIVERIQQSADLQSNSETDAVVAKPSGKEE